MPYTNVPFAFRKKKYDYVSPSVLWGRWIFAGYLHWYTVSHPTRKSCRGSIQETCGKARCKDYAFYLLSVCYLLWMCFPIMAPHLCWFILLTLPDSLKAARAERRSHNSFRSVVLMKSGEEKKKIHEGWLLSQPHPGQASWTAILWRSHHSWANRPPSPEKGCERLGGWCGGPAEARAVITGKRPAEQMMRPSLVSISSSLLFWAPPPPNPFLCSPIQQWAATGHPQMTWGPLELHPSSERAANLECPSPLKAARRGQPQTPASAQKRPGQDRSRVRGGGRKWKGAETLGPENNQDFLQCF